jgi:hypothetical protein
LKNKTIDSFAAQLRLSATAVLMRDINRKPSDTDKPITNALRRSAWLSYLLSLGAISAGGLSIFSVAAILDTKPAQADLKEPSANVTDSADKFDRQNLSVSDASVVLTPKADASTEFGFAPHVLAQPQSSAREVVNTTPIANSLSFVSAETVDNGNFLAQVSAKISQTLFNPFMSLRRLLFYQHRTQLRVIPQNKWLQQKNPLRLSLLILPLP